MYASCASMSTALQPCLPRLNSKRIEKAQLRSGAKEFNKPNGVSIPGHKVNRKIFCTPHSLEEEFSALQSNESSEDDDETSPLERPPNSEELKALLADSERSKLVRKLSEANQQNRFLKRQLRVKEDALVNFKSELASTELEIRALVNLAQEIASYNIPKDSKKINGKYIQSHLLSRLEAVQEKLEAHIKDVDAAQSREVPLFWHGMAESVHVMGSFDGWSQGEHLSPEYVDSYTTFSTTLVLRPGRYEIKFLVDGEWQLSPEIPTIGEGFVQNNLLIIE